MELLLPAPRKPIISGSRESVLPSTGTSTFSTLRPSMNHGSQRASGLTVSLGTRTIGVHTMPTDHPNSTTTHANTLFRIRLRKRSNEKSHFSSYIIATGFGMSMHRVRWFC